MKNIGFLLVLIFGAGQIFGQGIERRTYYDQEQTVVKEILHVKDTLENLLEGKYISYFLSGNVKSQGEFAYNKATGDWVYYYESGSIKNTGSFMRGRTMGIWTYYFENGNIRSEGILDDNVKVGEWSFHYEDGSIKSRGQFVNGIREGIWNYYYEGGDLKAQANFKDGSGQYKEFFVSGNLKMEGMNREGKSDSLWVYYYDTGERMAEGYYKQGLKTGTWKYYYKNGKLSAEGGYERGMTIGNWIYYYETGAKSAEGLQKNSMKDGYWKMFYETGETKGVGELDEGSGEYKEYYISGKLKVTGQFKDGHNDGRWIYYDEEGHVEGKADFEEGIGEYEGYYLNGDLKMKGKISDGKRIGEWTLYKKNGEVAGKYHPVYEEDNPIFFDEEEVTKPRQDRDYDKPEYRYKNRKSRYFTSVVNEYKGVIIGGNPVFSMIGFLPVSIEYYRQERMGVELMYTYYRSPFYLSHGDISNGEVFSDGFSLDLKQKFYSRDQNYGMFYFGHVLGAKFIDYNSYVMGDEGVGSREVVSSHQSSYYYSLMVGNRWTKHPGNAGVTLDVFFGVGVGSRNYTKDYVDSSYDDIFSDIQKSSIYPQFLFGINIGYLGFKKTKNLPVPTKK